ncbi:hypothetical protein [Pseudofrankia sp. BMG5.37]|uniref:hypothetical protein n=1 Tax=Pseudofrankia sp. BMG5.37 TaxID=3050035 RepID=UPI002893B3AC|nr:hypothetical protein [Pseudofrankia sp. BMG5.37]MDT3446820.1 hypothetical protein [Pseudofrankia sp. BMG5.37]
MTSPARHRLDAALDLARLAVTLAHTAAQLGDPYHSDDQLLLGETVMQTAIATERLATDLITEILGDEHGDPT